MKKSLSVVRRKMISQVVAGFCFLVMLCGCSGSGDKGFVVDNFSPISNYTQDQKSTPIEIDLDYTNAIDSGFIIPTQANGGESFFRYKFTITNNGGENQHYFYKIYYQNESYKFPEFEDNAAGGTNEHPRAGENFYGSWENTDLEFIPAGNIPADGKPHEITGQFRIVGNPRNEQIYFGGSPIDKYLPERSFKKKKEDIRNSPEWLANVSAKAKQNGISLEKQIELDADYILREETKQDTINNRWKRNPRVGAYRFMVVVCSSQDLVKIPAWIKNVSVTNKGVFCNPFYYFLKGDGAALPSTVAIVSDNLIKVKATPDPGKGIYVSEPSYTGPSIDRSCYNNYCGNDSAMYHNAVFRQYFHSLDPADFIENINVTADVNGNAYSDDDYNRNLTSAERIKANIQITDCPCKTVKSDSVANKILIWNPGKDASNPRKENVGVITRNGLTYGKYRTKVKMSNMLNDEQIWNGLTNAIWLINVLNEPWNARTICNNEGYIPKYLHGPEAKREKSVSYSEIDIEVVKCNRYWPETSYKDKSLYKKEEASDRDKVVITCTNWDLACPDPKRYVVGYEEWESNGNTWGLHRWDHWYQALTTKVPIAEKEVFDAAYYWFEIEWTPTEIIWRAGPEKDQMKQIAYMNEEITMIPNNQMLLVFTQEFHISAWWPQQLQPQENIPFLSKDIIGEILEVEIE
jgi:hypothetical protein